MDKNFNLTAILEKAKLHKENIYVAEYQNKQYTIQLDHAQKLHSIAYYDDLDNKVQILFKEMKYGKGKLPLKQMECTLPEGYDFIRG